MAEVGLDRDWPATKNAVPPRNKGNLDPLTRFHVRLSMHNASLLRIAIAGTRIPGGRDCIVFDLHRKILFTDFKGVLYRVKWDAMINKKKY